ncbi:hypothetical protein JX265_011783 [Neoarthrinium moseri]|uniref:Cell wall protein n=1 Tax=Neoarthrinium moseri TaxID=1658444 RepID=A0A9P9WBV8_9PEZI|nr:uncharacterized protein JN550_002083 [Neoarthrinium moseri]KAI1848171.1 hypothetical protein JX266_005884 [Neoarthrinium moseri]KAI1856271.1 hypothetical protein JX265_011783 [Neoarthrinium moseri]KAI1875797.1 hypothetical protein JN550_002083 [Neoarthrinium moseri]
MKSATPMFLLATGALAAVQGNQPRDLAQLEAIMNKVLQGLTEVDGATTAYTGGEAYELDCALEKMTDKATEATDAASKLDKLALEEAIGFQPLSNQLNAAGDKFVADLKNKIPLLSEACACEIIAESFGVLTNTASGLMNTVASKFPTQGGNGDIAKFTASFADTNQALKDCAAKEAEEGGHEGGHGGYEGGHGSPSGVPTGAPTGGHGPYPTGEAAPTGHPTAAPAEPTHPTYANGSSPAGGSGSSGGASSADAGGDKSTPTYASKPVVTAGASLIGFSGAALVAAAVAYFLTYESSGDLLVIKRYVREHDLTCLLSADNMDQVLDKFGE